LLTLIGGVLLDALPFFILKPDAEVIGEVIEEGKNDGQEILSDMASLGFY